MWPAIRRIAVGSRADFEAMNRAVSAHRMRPVIDRVLPFSEAVQAYRYFRDGGPFGKVVVELSEAASAVGLWGMDHRTRRNQPLSARAPSLRLSPARR